MCFGNALQFPGLNMVCLQKHKLVSKVWSEIMMWNKIFLMLWGL